MINAKAISKPFRRSAAALTAAIFGIGTLAHADELPFSPVSYSSGECPKTMTALGNAVCLGTGVVSSGFGTRYFQKANTGGAQAKKPAPAAKPKKGAKPKKVKKPKKPAKPAFITVADFHPGIDWAAPTGTPIGNMADCYVVATGFDEANGNYTILSYTNGLVAVLLHQSAIDAQPGQIIKTGEKLGEVGNTGKSRGAHLHITFMTYVDGQWGALNPRSLAAAGGVNASMADINRIARETRLAHKAEDVIATENFHLSMIGGMTGMDVLTTTQIAFADQAPVLASAASPLPARP